MPEQDLLLKIATDLATNTEATKNIEKHLVTLNGKVASQESFTRTLKTAVDLQSSSIEGLLDREKSRNENKSKLTWLTIENIFKAVFAIAIAYLVFKAGF